MPLETDSFLKEDKKSVLCLDTTKSDGESDWMSSVTVYWRFIRNNRKHFHPVYKLTPPVLSYIKQLLVPLEGKNPQYLCPACFSSTLLSCTCQIRSDIFAVYSSYHDLFPGMCHMWSRGNSNWRCSALVIWAQGITWCGGQEELAAVGLSWLDTGVARTEGLLCKGLKLPLVMRQEMPQCCLVVFHWLWDRSAEGPILDSRAGLEYGPSAELRCPVLTLMGLVPVQVCLKHWLMSQLCRLPVELFVAVGVCPMYGTLQLLYLSTNLC